MARESLSRYTKRVIEALIVIGGFIGVAAVGLFVSGRMTKWWSSAVYALMTASLGVLMVSGYYALSAENTIAVLWYARLCAVSVVIALACLFFLVQELIESIQVDFATRMIRTVVLCGTAVVLVLSFTSLVFKSVYAISGGRVFIDVSWGMVLYILYIVGVLVLIGFQLAEEARTAYRRRFGSLDVRYVVARTISYLATLLTVAIIFSFTVYGLSLLFIQSGGSAIFTPVGIFSALIVALIFNPLKRVMNKVVDGLMYKDNYSASGFIVRVSQTLNSTTDLRTLLERTGELIAGTIKASQAFFFVNLLDDRYITAGTQGHSRVSMSEFEGITDHGGVRHLPRLISQYDTDHPIHRMMASHRLGLVMPLFKNDTLVGYLCLGRSRKGGYTSRDIRTLRSISDELTVAIQNALSVDEVRKLNGTLEQRIEAATRELRASNAQLQRLDEAKDEFISMASHQLRTPLTSIKGYISMMLEGDAGEINKDQKHFLNEAFVSSERMVRLIGDFLNVSRLQTGKFVIEKRPVDLARLVQREVDGLEQNAAARGIKFSYKKPKDIPQLLLDENKIQQVIMNFSDNAIYYSKDKSKITVSLKRVGRQVEFTVTDTGIGVPKDEQSNLFNKFFRATNARKARPDGTGVGLFLAKKVINDHDGEIIFSSKEGKGSTFGFRLPIEEDN